MQIVLNERWTIDKASSLGAGGFGAVFAAQGSRGEKVVAKFVPKVAGAERELLMANLPASDHIVPTIDTAETDEDWVLIMPRADQSLRDCLQSAGTVPLDVAVDILVQVAQGLAVLDGHIVHRDLKPENVLLLDGKWALCDFGIARYAAATTSADTRKFSLSAPYASPEQWRAEHATAAADIYAFGVMAYEICVGARPFPGPQTADFREQHLNEQPPPSGLNARLASLIMECLFKAPGSRPRAENLLARLRVAADASGSPGVRRLAEAQRRVTEQRAEEERQASVARTEQQRRKSLYDSATALHELIFAELSQAIVEEAPAASVKASGSRVIHLGDGTIAVTAVAPASSGAFASYGVPVDVIAYAEIRISQRSPGVRYGDKYDGRSHSLYYADFEHEGEYAWYELAFMETMGSNRGVIPFAFVPDDQAGLALSNVFGSYQLGRPIEVLRPGAIDHFVDRWMGYLASASVNELARPSSLPEGSDGPHVIERRR